MKIATDEDQEDYNEYADYLAYWLHERLPCSGLSPQLLYELIQEFNKSLE